MNSTNSSGLNGIADVVGYVRKKGVRLWSEKGELHYKAPKGVLTGEEIGRLRECRGQIVAFLETSPCEEFIESGLEPRLKLDSAPLTFSQLAHWNLHHLSERPSVRQLASATRLCGNLNIDVLRASLAEMVRRHEALRTRIVVVDGIPMQKIALTGNTELELHDLTAFPVSIREDEVKRLIDRLILKPIHVDVGPLFGLKLIKVRDDEHVLAVAMEHMISDAFSMQILLRDLFTVYLQALKGSATSLPEISVQFAEYAIRQRDTHDSWIYHHGEYWNGRLAGCRRLRFPQDHISETDDRLGWGTVPLKIGAGLKAELQECCRLRRTTLVMSVFTAYVALVLRWCNSSDMVIRYQTDGRGNPRVMSTIGYFASVLHLRMRLLDGDNFIDLLSRVTEEYCKAYEHADFSYIDAQTPQPEFVKNASFNWVPLTPKSDIFQLDGSSGALTFSRMHFVNPVVKNYERDSEPVLLFHETETEIDGGVHFPLNLFTSEIIDRFGRNFMMFIVKFLRQPDECVKGILLQ